MYKLKIARGGNLLLQSGSRDTGSDILSVGLDTFLADQQKKRVKNVLGTEHSAEIGNYGRVMMGA